MPEERALLFRACCDHPVAKCRRCRCSFRMTELAADLFQRLSHLRPRCRIDLTDAAGEHLLSCAAATTLAAQRACADAQTIFATAADLCKEAQRLRDAAGAARAESEAARYAREDVPDSPTET